MPVQSTLPTGQSGGAEDGCLSKRLPSHWTGRWVPRGWMPVQMPALPTGQSGGRNVHRRGNPVLVVKSHKSCLTLVTPTTVACPAPLSRGISQGKDPEVGCHFFLQEFNPETEPGLLCRRGRGYMQDSTVSPDARLEIGHQWSNQRVVSILLGSRNL